MKKAEKMKLLFILILLKSIFSQIPKQGCVRLGEPPGAKYFPNTYINATFDKIPNEAILKMKEILPKFMELIDRDYPPENLEMVNYTPFLFYGISGRAYLHLRIFKNSGCTSQFDLDMAERYIEVALKNLGDPKLVGYLEGNVGIFAVASMIYNLQKNKEAEEYYLQKVNDVFKSIVLDDKCNFDRGIAGLIHTSYVLRNFYGKEVVDQREVQRVAYLLYQNGIRYWNSTTNAMQFRKGGEPMLDEAYVIGLGAGSSGAVVQLLKRKELMQNETIRKPIISTLEYFLTQQDPETGKVRSDYPERVQFCHGSPGFIEVFYQAYLALGEEKYLIAAKKAAEYTVKYGILTKGMIMGHGTAGNMYMVMRLYSQIKEARYLSKAISMLMVALDRPEYMDPEQWVSYDCIPGAMFVSNQGATIMLFSDLLAHLHDLENVTMPIYDVEW